MSAPISAAQVKLLREATGAGMMECKAALQESGGDMEGATRLLRVKGQAQVAKRAGRQAAEGTVTSYLHRPDPDLPPRVGVLVEVNCETDFVAKTEEFMQFASEIALHIAAANPQYVERNEVPEEISAQERTVLEAQLRSNAPDVTAQQIDERLEAYFKECVLLEQPYIREPSKTIRDLIDEIGVRVREKVAIRRFVRFAVGE